MDLFLLNPQCDRVSAPKGILAKTHFGARHLPETYNRNGNRIHQTIQEPLSDHNCKAKRDLIQIRGQLGSCQEASEPARTRFLVGTAVTAV